MGQSRATGCGYGEDSWLILETPALQGVSGLPAWRGAGQCELPPFRLHCPQGPSVVTTLSNVSSQGPVP